MDRFLGEDSVLVTIGAVFTIWMAVRAWRNGALESLWRLFSWVSGLLAGFWVFNNGSELLARFAVELDGGMMIVAVFAMSVVAFAITRLVVRSLFNKLFGKDSLLGGWMYGGTGSILSLLPSFALLLLAALLLRATGTIWELRQIDVVSANQQLWSLTEYPREPLLSKWRDGLEGLPRTTPVLDLADPISTPVKRNLAALLLACHRPELRDLLADWPATRAVVIHPAVVSLIETEDPSLRGILDKGGGWKYVNLLRHSAISAALKDDSLRKSLEKVDMADEIKAILTQKKLNKRQRRFDNNGPDTAPVEQSEQAVDV